jgi:RNA polymerase primary sigma factor
MYSDNGNGQDKLSIYLKEMRRFSFLSPEEEKEIGLKAKNNDQEAKKKLIEANLRLVLWLAKRYSPYLDESLNFSDLVQEGNLGLIRAIQDFDPEIGRLNTYAGYWIRLRIVQALRNHKDIHIPHSALEELNKIKKTKNNYYKEKGCWPTPQEISQSTEIPIKRVNRLLEVHQSFISLEKPVKNDDSLDPLSNFLADEKAINPEEAAQKKEMLKRETEALATLRPKEEKVLRKRFAIGEKRKYTLQEIAEEFNVTREWIRQIERKAIRKIREKKKYSLEDFLE